METSDLASTIRLAVYQLRSGRREQAYATLTLLLFGLGAALGYAPQAEFNIVGIDFPRLVRSAQVFFYALGALALILLAYRIWRQSVVVKPTGPPAPVSAAIKGLLPFTAADGELFARLGRPNELQRVLAVALNDHIGVCAVRGQSGAGKTSLLQAGLAFNLGADRSVYWEADAAFPAEGLLRAIQARFPQVPSLASLPAELPSKCVLIIDQFEQLSAKEPSHLPIFDLLARIARAPAPHTLSAVVGFRREYMPDWGDFEDNCGFQAEHIPINLFAPPTAAETLTVLAGEAGITLDNSLVDNFIAAVTRPEGVSPVDIAIGLLSLVSFAQQRGVKYINKSEYSIAGGAEGLLRSYVQEKLDEVPQNMRTPLLKGLVLGLVDAASGQRVAQGATATEIAAKADIPEALILPSLTRLARPGVRLLEKPTQNHYRLSHERLVPVLRRMAGMALAEQDQLFILFESEFERWRRSNAQRHLLDGKDLKSALRIRQSLVQGEQAGQKSSYLAASIRRRTRLRLAAFAALMALAAAGYAGARSVDSWLQRDRLSRWGLPPGLFETQHDVDSIYIYSDSMNDLGWLRATNLKGLALRCVCSTLQPLSRLKNLKTLQLWSSEVKSLTGLQNLSQLSYLELGLEGAPLHDLSGLETLKGLTSLDLDLHRTQVIDLSGLKKLPRLTELELIASSVTDLSSLGALKNLTKLTLTLGDTTSTDLSWMEPLENLTDLSLRTSDSGITDLSNLGRLKSLTNLELNLGASHLRDLTSLGNLPQLTSLSLDLRGSEIKDLSGLGGLTRLKKLTIEMSGIPAVSLAGLEKLTGLTQLTLRLNESPVNDLALLEALKGLTHLELDANSPEITSLSSLGKLNWLSSLDLSLNSSGVSDLSFLMKLTNLTDLKLSQENRAVAGLEGLSHLAKLSRLTMALSHFQALDAANLNHLSSLSLDCYTSPAQCLSGLERLSSLSRLSLASYNPEPHGFSALEKLPRLSALTLNMESSATKSLSGLDNLTQLASLEMDISGSRIGNLSEIAKLSSLTALTIDVRYSALKSLSPLKGLNHMKDLRITLPAKLVETFPNDEKLRSVAELTIYLQKDDPEMRIPAGFKSVAVFVQ